MNKSTQCSEVSVKGIVKWFIIADNSTSIFYGQVKFARNKVMQEKEGIKKTVVIF